MKIMSKVSFKILKKGLLKGRRKFLAIVGAAFLLLVLLHVTGVDAKAPEFIRVLAQKLYPSVAKNSAPLPVNIQKAIIAEAQKELTQGADPEHFDVKAEVDFEDIGAAKTNILPDSPLYFFKRFGRGLGEFFTFDPLAKTQIILKNNSKETVETLLLLQKSLSEKNSVTKNLQISIVAEEINRIESRFNQILNISTDLSKTDKNKARTIQTVAFNYAEKYFRSELILKVLEDKLDDASMIKLETARLKGLAVFGKILVGYHPDPQVLSRELARALAKVAGSNYTELKTAEILQEIEGATADETQKTSLRLAQYLLIKKFENKVLAIPFSDREKLLENYISQLSGNPMQEFKTLTRIRRVFNSRHLIIWTEVYKARILEKFEERVAGLKTSDLQKQFVGFWVKDPADLRILEALELRGQGNGKIDSKLPETLKKLKDLGYLQIADIYKGNSDKLGATLFYKSATAYPDVLDMKVALSLGKTFNNSGFIKELEKQLIKKFSDNLPKSLSNISTKPLPATVAFVAEVKAEAPLPVQNEVEAAINAEIKLDSVEVPKTSTAIGNLVSQLENSQEIATETQTLSIPIKEIISVKDNSSTQPTQQEILEQSEKIVAEILSAPAGVETPVETSLPANIQQEIEQLQKTTSATPQIDSGLVTTVVNTVPATEPTPAPIETPPPTTVSVPSL